MQVAFGSVWVYDVKEEWVYTLLKEALIPWILEVKIAWRLAMIEWASPFLQPFFVYILPLSIDRRSVVENLLCRRLRRRSIYRWRVSLLRPNCRLITTMTRRRRDNRILSIYSRYTSIPLWGTCEKHPIALYIPNSPRSGRFFFERRVKTDSGVFLGRNLGELGIDSGYAKILYITQKFSQVYNKFFIIAFYSKWCWSSTWSPTLVAS